ncbi:hypothetical protein SADUNF_Sadunf13G0078300 [Salix dunnii]|uniref:Molybdopterin synthase sulfur carrier subunit n=1 Tax=Salix dunnii TaxID=1413687 RepID=A0A835JIW3_9ROSI|nr:hypothetical protein SADUNF_Sadunf13G0078300 [Salix dunnii]
MFRKVLFFAVARDLTGLTDLPLEVSSGCTISDCLEKHIARFPSMEEIRGVSVATEKSEDSGRFDEVVDEL